MLFLRSVVMTDSVTLDRIAVRRAELDLLEEQMVKRLADARVERDEVVVAERVVQRISEQGFGEYLSLAPALSEAQVGGRSVLLIPARVGGLDDTARQRRERSGMGCDQATRVLRGLMAYDQPHGTRRHVQAQDSRTTPITCTELL